MLDHFAGDDDLESFFERDVFESLQIRPEKIFAARSLQNIQSLLVEIETVKLARRPFKLEMQQHIVFQRFFRIRIIRAAEMQNFFPGAFFLYKFHPLDQLKFFFHIKFVFSY